MYGNDAAAALGLRPVRRRHWGRWASAVIIVLLLAAVVRAFATGAIEWDVVGEYLTADMILEGLANTAVITAAAMLLGVLVGILIAVLRLSANPVANAVAAGYVWFFRGVPVLLQLLIWYNLALVFPSIGVPGLWEGSTVEVMTPFMATLLGLGLHQSAYTAEIVRGGILAVDRGQTEAALSLALPSGAVFGRIVLPQAMRVIIPPLGNEFISTLKTSSLAAVVTYGELLQSAQLVYYRNNRVIELLIVVAVWYLAVVSVLAIGQYAVERRYGRGFTPTRDASGPGVRGRARGGVRARKTMGSEA
ncbi:amino acid ABC transporter permease [Streptomyces radicis]|uniref:Amino acid ABC transporter permease n=1 Tax=Streptomyces radicis TaxID=1750517 RepID=A0A3A9WHI6_9ACTN|nr:amino acid ABC transporter permease [Streptomyces radicis]RKN12488.1 amino acid ABC transporter permease [Streptomyces radicis]RKN27744.1 amino acid ABC transporter permease [Streptomyces radicis]